MKKNTILQNNNSNFKKGFTLIETLVAISILTLSITTLLSVIGQGVFNSNYAKNKVVALGLAQEGVEIVRNIQDSALLSASGPYADFATFANAVFPECYGPGIACTIDSKTTIPATNIPTKASCPIVGQDVVCPPMKINDGYYNQSIGTPTLFTRSISIEPIDQFSGKVLVVVSWIQGNVEKKVTYEVDIFLWI